MNVQDRIDNAVPALGYTLVPLRYRGVKMNEFDPNQPRDENGKWTAAGECSGVSLATKLHEPGYHESDALFYPTDSSGVALEAAQLKILACDRIAFRIMEKPDSVKAMQSLVDWFAPLRGLPSQFTPDRLVKTVVGHLINSWATTSSDHNELALALQKAALSEFGGDASFIKSREEGVNAGRYAIYTTPEMQAGLRVFLRAQYDETQFFLKRNKIEELTLFRGVHKTDGYDDDVPVVPYGSTVKVAQNPMSSWSTDFGTASNFSREGTSAVILGATFKSDDIIAMPGRGFGCQEEQELVVRGGSFSATVIQAYNPHRDESAFMEHPGRALLREAKEREEEITDDRQYAALTNNESVVFNLDKEDVNADWIDRSKDVMLNTPHVNEQDEEGNEGRWVTMSGTPVFIKDGEDAGAAAARTFKNKPSTEEPQKKEGALKKWLREKTAPLREAFEQGRVGAKPSTPMQKAIPVTSKPAAVSGKIQRIREVGLGAKETVAELFYKRHVDEVFSGKVTAADKVDALIKKGVIKTGSEKPDVVRERAIRDFDKAVVLREQAAADRTESGEGKRAYTDKTLRAGLQKGETLAERYFPGHVDDLYNGTTSVTAKVDSMIEGGELGFGRGDKGFTKMRETAIKDFTRALNLREAADVREEKRKLEDAKPKKLTKREQQAEWSPSEDEVLASGPVVSSGTGWKRNMAENQPRDEDGKWTKDGGAVGVSFTATRFRPVERISFDRPLVGPSGAKLTGYEWKWQPQDYVDDRGEDRVRRVSDWGAAETSADTGRDIVHQFIVQMSNGEARTVSAESVPVLLGFSERGKVAGLPTLVSATKTLAQLKMKLAIAQARVDENNRISKHVETVTPPFEQLQILKGDVSAFGRVYNEEYAHTFILPSPRGNGETVRERQSRSSTERLDTGVLLGRTREILVDKWRAALAETMGYAYVSDYTDLKRRAERQEHKVQQLTSSPKANAFDPNQPRDTDGKWTGGTLSFKGEPEKVGAFTKDVAIRRSTVTGPDGKPVMTWHNPDGSQVTDEKVLARIEEAKGTALFIPGYKGAWLNPDVTSDLIGFGFDQADRAQYVYTKEHAERSNAKTFKIVDEMRTKIDGMRAGAAKDRKAGVAAAFLFKLEDMTCIRVGSDNDTKAKKQAYGLTTLRGEHVKVEGSVVRLDFTAKGGHPVSYKIKDRELATFIAARKEQNGDGPLWPDVSNSKFNAYLKSLEPGAEITAHKFRHYHATRLAEGVVAQYEGKTLGAKEFKAVQREACEAAAAHLANTWSICREEYVNPTVWGRLTVSR